MCAVSSARVGKSFSPLFNPAYDAAAKAIKSAALRKKFEWVATELGCRPYIAGDAFTAADAYLFTVTNWSGHVKLDLADLRPLQDYVKRVAARPAVQAAMKAEGLIGS